MFKHLYLSNWRQFDNVDIAFHERLTILTGANGSGKTTMLNILNRHLGWNLQFVSTPKKTRKGVVRYLSDIWRKPLSDSEDVSSSANSNS